MDVKIKKNDLKSGVELEQNGEKITLVECADEGYMTLIEDIVDSVDSNPMIYGKQRWLVDVEEDTPFSGVPPFRTHRDIIFEVGLYRKRRVSPVEEDGKIVYKETIKELDISVREDSGASVTTPFYPIVDRFITLWIDGELISVF